MLNCKQPLLKKYPLTPRRRSRELSHHSIQFVYICLGHSGGPPLVVICNRDDDDATMPVLPGVGGRRQPAASVFLEPASVHLAPINCLYQSPADGAAAEHCYKQHARTFNPQQ